MFQAFFQSLKNSYFIAKVSKRSNVECKLGYDVQKMFFQQKVKVETF